MIEVDGSAGGGQIVRSALALAGVRGETVRIEDVRGNRPNPGLKHQHLACVEAAAAVCDADVDGADLGSETVTFHPGDPTGGEVAVDVGTAGAATLVFETVLPFAVVLRRPLELTVTGGTDVAWSPTVDYYRRVRLPLADAFGWCASVDVARHGFYPRGGGEATLRVEPSTVAGARFDDRGALDAVRVHAVASEDLVDAEVPDRLVDGAIDALADGGIAVDDGGTYPVETNARAVPARSTGASVLVELDYERSVAGFSALGEPGKPAETVGSEAATDALAFHDRRDDAATDRSDHAGSPPVVDRYAADQLVLPLALAGGRVHPDAVTAHVETNCEVARRFGYDVRVDGDVIVAA